ncbi:STAS domain-containing protein [Micromonospora sp. C28ISP2-4]|uniref:STAS domain-containing protein n=1 Tax=Micromonospora sp. C28ISP2-4 TaxID=3059523 RepID=UPI002675D0D9|nr:STAS domain-containing protein [Micromonospora sp. C28ISP2-4]MDO3683292.1 STAS domain-containing protein [Micromonospora sp. C28ISP2-4]
MTTRQGRVGPVIEVAGDLDMASAPQLRDRLLEMVNSGAGTVVVDLTQVGFVDSSGLGALVFAYKSLRGRDGWMGVAGVRQPVRNVFSITSVDRVIPLFDTVRDAEDGSEAAVR